MWRFIVSTGVGVVTYLVTRNSPNPSDHDSLLRQAAVTSTRRGMTQEAAYEHHRTLRCMAFAIAASVAVFLLWGTD